jgi:hypothetical protein
MRRIALLVLFLTATSVFAQEASKVPDISFRLVNDFFQIPSDMVMAEAVGVALNSKGHIFILNRGNHPSSSSIRTARLSARSARARRCSARRTASGSTRRTTSGT